MQMVPDYLDMIGIDEDAGIRAARNVEILNNLIVALNCPSYMLVALPIVPSTL